jgi:acyl-CoA synthetase (AMP-forming)/AMP-acid ligase II
VGPGGTLSYAEAHGRPLRLARAFTALGLRKGDVVAIQLPNVPEFVIAYFAISMIGAVACPMHMPYGAAEMAPLLHHARASRDLRSPDRRQGSGGYIPGAAAENPQHQACCHRRAAVCWHALV